MSLEYAKHLPTEIKFCKKCVMPNTRPSSSNEYLHTHDMKHNFLEFDAEGVCTACRFNEAKDRDIDWAEREKELLELLSRYRSKDGSYDCLVPGSGGKDSVYASHVLKHKYGMHPLTVTWAPHLYTEIGWKNFNNWLHKGGFDNYLFTPNGKLHREMTRKSVQNLLHPFQPFILGQKTFATKMAARFNIPLIFYGESPGEYGAKIGIDQKRFLRADEAPSGEHNQGFRMDFVDPSVDPDRIFLGGQSARQYLDDGWTMGDLEAYLPLDPAIAEKHKLEFHYLGYYLRWVPQECFYYAANHVGFEVNPARTEGTYSKYNSIDDKTDGYFYYTTYIKYGYGRATQDASQEIRNHHITREEGAALVKRFDGEFPTRFYPEFLEYISMTDEEFRATIDSFRSPAMWTKEDGEWRLKHAVYYENSPV